MTRRPPRSTLFPSTPPFRSTLYAWYKDAANNVSATAAASILLDQTAPTNGTLTPTAGSTQITLSWAGFTDAGSGLSSAKHTSELNHVRITYAVFCFGTKSVL